MDSYAKKITEAINGFEENQLIVSRELYNNCQFAVSELNFYKILERLTGKGDLIRVSKGIYYRPKKTKYGIVPIKENEIMSYFIENNRGLIKGYYLFNMLGLTTQISRKIEVYSNVLTEVEKTVGNVSVSNINIELEKDIISLVQAFEVLQNYKKIEDVNKKALIKYFESIADIYKEDNAKRVIENIKYKKSTIAFMEKILKYYGVKNNLSKYLSGTSVYSVPEMEELYELA